MLRALFLPEFKRSLLQKLVVVVPILLGLAVLEYVIGTLGLSTTIEKTFNGDLAAVINMLLAVLIVISTFMLGAGTFSRINERHIPFTHALPLSRLEVWVSLAGAHAITTVLMVPTILILRPSMVRWMATDLSRIELPTLVGIGIVLFAAGSCFVMLFRSLVPTLVVGSIVVAISCTLIVPFAASWNAKADAPRIYGIPVTSRIDPAFWVVACLLLATIYFGLSLRFFSRGEFNLSRRKLKNWSVLIAALVVFPVVLAAGVDVGALRFSELGPTDYAVSPTGQYLAVLKHRAGQRQRSEITIIETSTGKVVNTYSSRGLYGDVFWSGTAKPVANILYVPSALARLAYVLPPSDTLLRISPDGSKPSKASFGFAQIGQVVTDYKNRIWLTAASGSKAKLFSVSDEGVVHEEVSTPLRDDIRIQRTGKKMLFLASSQANGLERGWELVEHAKEIPYSPKAKSHAEGKFLFTDGWYSEKEGIEELERRFGLAKELVRRGPNAKGQYYASRDYFSQILVMSTDHVFALVTDKTTNKREILMSSPKTGGWRTLGDARLISSFEAAQKTYDPMSFFFPGVTANVELGFATYMKQDGASHVAYLYDVALDRLFELGRDPQIVESSQCLQIDDQNYPGLDAILVRCRQNFFAYRPGRDLRSITIKNYPLFASEDGTRIETKGRKGVGPVISQIAPDGTETQLWPMR
jgi:hypothetical protein